MSRPANQLGLRQGLGQFSLSLVFTLLSSTKNIPSPPHSPVDVLATIDSDQELGSSPGSSGFCSYGAFQILQAKLVEFLQSKLSVYMYSDAKNIEILSSPQKVALFGYKVQIKQRKAYL